ncbi:hypothetical protein SCHPADRAFT_833534 [Schizopora paradoxa]|uniref:P-loop containing nucleoside triphosphate hydrolase protein n=1 Tax=Schizopora paradoxa TaxID=27342 RepID=A0A0H2RD05_9AGAM|nr:hypothetical protein SCHPADRAFT_833534 [Schizopora paradoxa]
MILTDASQLAQLNGNDKVTFYPQKGAGIFGNPIALQVQSLVKLIDELRALGAEAFVDLPGIVVIGNQSAGKSSLVEAIGAIPLPRDISTCTRCPIECRLKNVDKDWSCQIRLRRNLDGSSLRGGLTDMDVAENALEENFGPLLTDKSNLDGMIRRAQLAILHRSVEASTFVDLTDDEIAEDYTGDKIQTRFSSDVVCLEIESRDVTDLSFIDLPGIIAYDPKGEENVQFVEDLVKENIRGNKLILLTIPMKEDFQLQKAVFLAKKADPLGVFTKPDTLKQGEHEPFVEILTGRNQECQLHHGYFVTRLPNVEERKKNLSHSDVLAQDKGFFEEEKPWSELLEFRDQMGVANLTTKLSLLLSQLITKSLPGIRNTVKQSLSETVAALDKLPTAIPENAAHELYDKLVTFRNDVHKLIEGENGFKSLVQHCRGSYTELKDNILSSRPNFQPTERPETQEPHEPIRMKTVIMGNENVVQSTSDPLYLDDLRKKLQSEVARELPFNLPFTAKRTLMLDYFEIWSDHSFKCFDSVTAQLRECLVKLANEHFGQYILGGLEEEVRNIIELEIDRHAAQTKCRIEWLLDLEQSPFTNDENEYAKYRESYLGIYKQGRKVDSSNATHSPRELDEAFAALAKIGIKGLSVADLSKLRGGETFEEELTVMAEVSTYFQIAYKRFIDNLPRIIDHDFLRALDKDILRALGDGLQLNEVGGNSLAERYLAESPETTIRRSELLARKERLEEIMHKLKTSHQTILKRT